MAVPMQFPHRHRNFAWTQICVSLHDLCLCSADYYHLFYLHNVRKITQVKFMRGKMVNSLIEHQCLAGILKNYIYKYRALDVVYKSDTVF